MGGVNVKNTIVERVLEVIAPHPCSGCGKMGTLLCPYCKYDIICEPFVGCILCGARQARGICELHHAPLEGVFTVGVRDSTLEAILNKLKFERVKAAAAPLAELIVELLPRLPEGVVIVPIPTVQSHVRQRGYDQVDLLARHVASFTGISVARVLRRKSNATQHIVGRVKRQQQAEQAFTLRDHHVISGKTVLLLDDIVTTGATLLAAAELLYEAGARVYAVTLAYQPLD